MVLTTWKLLDAGRIGTGPWTRLRVASRARRVFLERLEDRQLLATDVWTGAVSSSWSDPSNWSLNAIPGTGDIASFTGLGTGSSNAAVTLDVASSISGISTDSTWGGTLIIEAAFL